MGGRPVRDGAALPVRQQIDGAAALKIADDRSVALALQPGKVVDADHANRGGRRSCTPPQEAQQRVGADRHGESFCKPSSRTAAEREGDRVDEHVETRGASGVSLDEVGGEALREDPTLARGVPASEPPCCQTDPEPSTMAREIPQGTSVAARTEEDASPQAGQGLVGYTP